jgi:thioredoxin-like negative regulator of GroEL
MRHSSRLALPSLLVLLTALPVLADAVPPDDEDAKKVPAKEEKALIPWQTSYATATKAAQGASKPILFDFHTGWCPHCTRMDKTTWKDPAVAKLAEKFVVAKINADVEKVPVSRYKLTGYPTVIVAEPGGEQVLRLEGYKDGPAISAALTAYLASATEIQGAFKTLASDKKNAGALLAMGDFYSKAGVHSQAADSYVKAAKTAQGPDRVRAEAGAGSALVKAGRAKEATKILTAGLAAAGPGATPGMWLAMGEAEAAQGRADAARQWFEKVVAAAPESPEAAAAKKALAGA